MMLALYCLRSLGVSSHWVLIFCCLRVPRNNPKPTPLIFVIISTQFHSLWCRGSPNIPSILNRAISAQFSDFFIDSCAKEIGAGIVPTPIGIV